MTSQERPSNLYLDLTYVCATQGYLREPHIASLSDEKKNLPDKEKRISL
jgi:hypothetical protein